MYWKGFWKCCIACKGRRLQTQLHDASGANSRLCHRCSRQRHHSDFAKDSDVCSSCKLHISFEIAACTVCGKSKHLTEMLQTADDEQIYVCITCKPEKWYFECTVCNGKTSYTEFQASKNALEKYCIRRCRACETCAICKKRFEDYRHFALNASKCWPCYQSCNQEKERLLFCDVCKENLSIDAFNHSDTQIYVKLRNLFRYSFLRCRNCATCKTCGIALSLIHI